MTMAAAATARPDRPVLPAVRLRLIETLLDDEGAASTAQVAERFGVSEMTARRDLNRLAATGRYTRVHGGLLGSGPCTSGRDGFP